MKKVETIQKQHLKIPKNKTYNDVTIFSKLVIESQYKIGGIKLSFFMEKLFIVCTFDCSFKYYAKTVDQWVKEQWDEIVIDYDLVKINNHKSHSFYKISS